MMVKRKFPPKKKKLSLKKRAQTLKKRPQTPSPITGRTKDESKALRKKAMIFLMFASLKKNGLEKLQELGYDSYYNKCLIEKHGVGGDYMWDLQLRKDFKPLFFELVTAYMSKDLMPYLKQLLKGREASKGAQILFPEEVGKALATRTIGISGDSDDEDFRNEFFGFKPKKEKS